MMNELLEQNCPLIPRDLFRGDSILVPIHVNPIDSQCNIKYGVVSLLEEHGRVWTEVLSGGRADVLFELSGGQDSRVLIEVKKTIHDIDLSKNRKSLLRYLDINYVNLFYLLLFDPMSGPVERIYDEDARKRAMESYADWIYKDPMLQGRCGIIYFCSLGKFEVAREPAKRKSIGVFHEPVLKEDMFCYVLWRHFRRQGYLVAAQCGLPSLETSRLLPYGVSAGKHWSPTQQTIRSIPAIDLTFM